MKDRPAVVALATQEAGGRVGLLVAPVTPRAPEGAAMTVEMPANIKRDLKLDRERSWTMASQVNSFHWPRPDVRLLEDGTPLWGGPGLAISAGEEGSWGLGEAGEIRFVGSQNKSFSALILLRT